MRTPLLMALGALALPSAAQACGGFFCNPNQPVDQKGEEILFAVDSEQGTVQMHVQIEYEGAAEDFAWVLPAPADPQLSIGTDAVFPVLGGLRARFNLNRDLGACEVPMAASSSSATYDGGAGGGVEVIRSGNVGPYETVTLQAQTSAALVDWLQTNNFDIPASLDPALAPYVSPDSYFVALRLQKNKDVGDLEPLVLTYAGSMASIPIQLTSVAATPDMRLRVYILGDYRAVPESYLHVRLNHLAVNWWTGGDNLDDAITRAADEAGGHAFFTDYSGTTANLRGQLFQDSWDTVDWAAQTSAVDLLANVAAQRIPVDDNLLGVLSLHLGLPEQGDTGTDLVDVLSCLSSYGYGYYYGSYQTFPDDCYASELEGIAYDAVALADDLETVVLEPRRRVEELFGTYGKITRMTSSVSPVEMTVDPTFVFNPDMGDVEQTRFADEIWFCRDGDLSEADRELHLADGRVVPIPSQGDLNRLGLTEFEWLEANGLTSPATAIIEDTTSSGQPTLVVDNRALLEAQLSKIGGDSRGCGCNTPSSPAGWLAALPLAAFLRRRQR